MVLHEEVFTAITSISNANRVTLSEAVIIYANQADNDVEEVIAMLDKTAIATIKHSLRGSIQLKPSMRVKTNTLFDEFFN